MKFILDHIFLVGIAVLSGGALLWPALTQRGKKASPQQVTLLINRAKATIVDVRDAAAFGAGLAAALGAGLGAGLAGGLPDFLGSLGLAIVVSPVLSRSACHKRRAGAG